MMASVFAGNSFMKVSPELSCTLRLSMSPLSDMSKSAGLAVHEDLRLHGGSGGRYLDERGRRGNSDIGRRGGGVESYVGDEGSWWEDHIATVTLGEVLLMDKEPAWC